MRPEDRKTYYLNGEVEIAEVDCYEWLDKDDWARVAHNVAVQLAAYEETGLEPEEMAAVMALAEKMNVCDLVRENLRLSNTIRHLEADLKAVR